MKSRMLVSMLVIALAAAVIGGATMAWFTDEATVADVEFTAGTVEVAVGEAAELEGKKLDNVNPGDTYTLCWDIENVGTKSAVYRVELNGVWSEVEEGGEELVDPASFAVVGEDWEFKDGYFYYKDPVAGTYGSENDEGETVKFCVDVTFAGEDMGNEYQGATYTLSGTVDAVQASHNAADAVWGEGNSSKVE